MTQRFTILVTILFTLHNAANAQNSIYNGKRPIIVSEEEIRHMEVSGNIGVVLRKERGDDVNVRMDTPTSDKVKVSVRNGKVYIVAKDSQPSDERLIVYAWFDNLETLTVNGNAIVNSVGVLSYNNLVVNLDKGSKISLKTVGKIRVNAPEDYQYVQKQQYFSVDTEERK
jgi:Putative auto-transporter adhesin, head GIN domain